MKLQYTVGYGYMLIIIAWWVELTLSRQSAKFLTPVVKGNYIEISRGL